MFDIRSIQLALFVIATNMSRLFAYVSSQSRLNNMTWRSPGFSSHYFLPHQQAKHAVCKVVLLASLVVAAQSKPARSIGVSYPARVGFS